MVLRRRDLTKGAAARLLRGMTGHRRALALTLLLAVMPPALPETASAASLPPGTDHLLGEDVARGVPNQGQAGPPVAHAQLDRHLQLGRLRRVPGARLLVGERVGLDRRERQLLRLDTATLSLAAAKNPVAGGWFLNETSDFPSPGWKYVATGVPSTCPGPRSRERELQLSSVRRASAAERDAAQTGNLLARPARRNTKRSWSRSNSRPASPRRGPGRSPSTASATARACPRKPTSRRRMTLTVSATSPAAGNNIKTNPAPSGEGRSPKSGPPRPKTSEARLKQLKEQAREDLGPALEEAWKAHGLSVALGLNSGLAFSTVLDELGQTWRAAGEQRRDGKGDQRLPDHQRPTRSPVPPARKAAPAQAIRLYRPAPPPPAPNADSVHETSRGRAGDARRTAQGPTPSPTRCSSR